MGTIKRRLSYRFQEASAYLHWIKSSGQLSKSRRFLLIARERTGSNLLIDLMNSHPNLHCLPEGRVLFKRRNTLFLKQYLEGLSVTKAHSVVGAKVRLKSIQLQRRSPQTFLSNLVANDWKLILLHRENHFDRALSLLVAQQRRQWHHRGNRSEQAEWQAHIDIDALFLLIGRNIKRSANVQTIMRSLPHLEIVYEHDLQHAEAHQPTLDRMFDYLNLPSHRVVTTHKKIMPTQLADVITNYGEMVEAIRQSDYAKYLDK